MLHIITCVQRCLLRADQGPQEVCDWARRGIMAAKISRMIDRDGYTERATRYSDAFPSRI